MRDLFLDLVHKQPSARIFYGSLSSDKGKDASDKGKDASDKGKDSSDKGKEMSEAPMLMNAGVSIISKSRYEISPERQLFIAFFQERSRQGNFNPQLLNEHHAYLQHLNGQGTLVLAGSYAAGEQGVQVIWSNSLAEAAAIVENDPLFKSGYYGKAYIDNVASRCLL
ncbi:YciI family protein [Paenibacillus profundus]|uniref:YciI family protein n=1 Tax=Paenibacillus profundus TaxID=1173085 RepID=A0ABS8YTD8_9BACL|nr:YciI family protein [Paenibacillus profundus]MCE5173610.1 YciI family protein [Paenibacillus profundus]